ncbi:MAG TPA: MerR family transcriptional regulator [Anaerolineaceae bacterium]|nr:MerR family transcriptional regulator [Anaerolineaceae bacterium]
MQYKVNELSKLSGVSTRTLRYYDQIGLLEPENVGSNGYRLYGQSQVDKLQQILFYRELGLALDEIKDIVNRPGFDPETSLEGHLVALQKKREQLDMLIRNVKNTINALKEGDEMSDEDKFEGFKQNLIKENTRKYGPEITKKYGASIVEASNHKLADMTQAQWQEQESLSKSIFEFLAIAMVKNDPACYEAQKAADLHRQWLRMFWKDGAYSKQAHLLLAEMYVSDPRFTAFYDDKLGKGTAQLLRDAVAIYTKE